MQTESTMAESILQGKVAIVTGAGSPNGIGHAITLGLLRAGARVAMLDINQAWLEQSADEMRAVGGMDSTLPMVADITGPEAMAQWEKFQARTTPSLATGWWTGARAD